MSAIKINSEIKTLKKVLVHRPGKELENLTPNWLELLLFDDIPWLKEAQIEHDEFVKTLRDNGVLVIYLRDLVDEALYSSEIKDAFIKDFLNEANIFNKELFNIVRDYLYSLNTKAMIDKMIAGISQEEILSSNTKSLKTRINDYPFICDPMPNLYFTRDPFSSIIEGVAISKMHSNIRARETIFAKYIFKYHKDYKNIKKYYNRDFQASIEGGDILVLSDEVLALGISERTDPDGIEELAKRLFRDSSINKVIAINLPKLRHFMHLDTVLTQVDYNKFVVHHDFLKQLDIYILEKDNDNIKITEHFNTIKNVFDKELNNNYTMIPCGSNSKIASDREQWNDGANTLAIAPGLVVAYERNTVTNKLLREHGIKVLEIKSGELSRGRGGPRCMSMPLIRE